MNLNLKEESCSSHPEILLYLSFLFFPYMYRLHIVCTITVMKRLGGLLIDDVGLRIMRIEDYLCLSARLAYPWQRLSPDWSGRSHCPGCAGHRRCRRQAASKTYNINETAEIICSNKKNTKGKHSFYLPIYSHQYFALNYCTYFAECMLSKLK